MSHLDTAKEVKTLAAGLGADLCGIASADSFSGAPKGFKPADVLPGCRSVIVTACRFLSGTLRAASSIPYTDVRNHLTRKMDDMSIRISYALEETGTVAVPVNAIGPCDWDPVQRKSMGIISLKHAAELAGLGRIGKNTLLVNDRYGNMIWLGAVLTERTLEADQPAAYKTCPPGCSKCLDICPVKAMDGVSIDQKACWNHAFGIPAAGGEWRIKCFGCRAVCPFREGLPSGIGKTDRKR